MFLDIETYDLAAELSRAKNKKRKTTTMQPYEPDDFHNDETVFFFPPSEFFWERFFSFSFVFL